MYRVYSVGYFSKRLNFRKRLRKSSTGSGSGSTERPAAEEQPPVEAMLMSPGGSTTGTVIKPDPGGFSSDCSSSTITRGGGKMLSGESDGTYRGSSSHESLEGDVPHQITLVRIFILISTGTVTNHNVQLIIFVFLFNFLFVQNFQLSYNICGHGSFCFV